MAGSSLTDYTYNAANQLVSATTGAASTTYSYDELGRQIRAATGSAATTYEWDALGKLTRIAAPGTTTTYAYGIDGTRSLKSVTTASGTKTTKQLWSGVKLLAELDSDGTRYDYLYGPDGAPLELRVKVGATTTQYAYQVDAGGSVIGITDSNGAEVARYAYDPYGNPLVVEGTGTLKDRNPLRYRGYCYDAESGYYHMPARYYDPASARFVSVDPKPPRAGAPSSLNGYSYCFGDPVGLVDPDGRGDILNGNYYGLDTDSQGVSWQDIYEPNVPQMESGPGMPAHQVAQSSGAGTANAHGTPSSGQKERQAAEARRKGFGIDWGPVAPDPAGEAIIGVVAGAAAGGIVTGVKGLLSQGAVGYGSLAHAEEYGVQSYKALRAAKAGTGLEAHHLIEARFAGTLGTRTGDMAAVALTRAEHQVFTNLWRSAIPYGEGTALATPDQIYAAARTIYAGHPRLLAAVLP